MPSLRRGSRGFFPGSRDLPRVHTSQNNPWPVAPRGKALPQASPGATMVPPPLSGFPSGLTSFCTPTSHCPQGVIEATGKVVLQSLSPTGFPKPFPHTSQSQTSGERGWGEGELRGELKAAPAPGSVQTPFLLLKLHTRLHSPCNNRALGIGCCFCSWAGAEHHGKASWVLTV